MVPMVTVTSDHKLEGLKTAEIDLSQLRGLKSKNEGVGRAGSF